MNELFETLRKVGCNYVLQRFSAAVLMELVNFCQCLHSRFVPYLGQQSSDKQGEYRNMVTACFDDLLRLYFWIFPQSLLLYSFKMGVDERDDNGHDCDNGEYGE